MKPSIHLKVSQSIPLRTLAAALVSTLAATAVIGCNQEDVSNIKNDTSKLGHDLAPVVKNASLATKVNTHLTLHKGVDMSGLHVDVSDSTVTVSGYVRDANMHRVVVNVLRETTGVDRVVDKLRVEKR